jgi:formyltetrahydrofolate-dependent phosphoribosylglycinamide formyltransferase
LISGRGSNLAALLAAARRPDYPVQIALVISNVGEAPGLGIGSAAGVPVRVLDQASWQGDRAGHEAAMTQALEQAGVELVCLAGFMRRLTPAFVGRWAGRLLNIHPSLLPAFPGLDTHARALAAGVRMHGCTVHLVTDAVDAGPILGQAAVPVHLTDDAASLGARVLAIEHVLYPWVVEQFALGRIFGRTFA